MSAQNNRRLAAVLFADIVGYTALMQSDEGVAMAHLEKFKQALELEVPKNQGEIIQFYGDGCLCTFTSSVDALTCAKNLQTIFQTVPKVPVRIGLNAGDIILKEGNVFGHTVNVASRVESMGIPGAVLLSSNVQQQLKNKPQFKLQSLGKFDFKNVDNSLEVFALANEGFPIPKKKDIKGKLKAQKNTKANWALPIAFGLLVAVATFFGLNYNASPTTPSIAVLPFKDMSVLKDQEYFGDGIAEEILNSLSKLKALKVAGRTSSFSFKGKGSNISEIGEALQVKNVLEGSVSKQNDKIRVTAQLINVADGFQIWSDKYERKMNDVFAVQDELAQNIGEILLKKLAPEQLSKLTASAGVSSKIYELFLKAKHIHKNIYNSSHLPADFQKSEKLFLEAINLAPDYALAHAGLADLYDSYWVRIPIGDTEEKEKYLELMDLESSLALKLDNKLAYANQVRGYVLSHLGQQKSAFKHFLKSYQISPNNPESIIGLANLYLDMGLHYDALQFAKRTLHIDPLFRSGLTMQIYCNFYLNNLEATANQCQSFLDIDPNNMTALEYLFKASFLLKDTTTAFTTLQKMEQLDPSALSKSGLDLEIALLKNNKTYIDEILNDNNPNLNFTIHSFYQDSVQAVNAYELATADYLKYALQDSPPQNSLYLDLFMDRQLKAYQSTDWFQKALEVEKVKYDYLAEEYPRAAAILE